MSDLAALNADNYDNMTTTEFEDRLPELLAGGPNNLTEDPRFATFFEKNPDCAALVRDLKAIADAARLLLQPEDFASNETEEEVEPGDEMWAKIKGKLSGAPALDEPNGTLE